MPWPIVLFGLGFLAMALAAMIHAWHGRQVRERVEPALAVLMNVARLPAGEAQGVLDRSPTLSAWQPHLEKESQNIVFGPVSSAECEAVVHQALAHLEWFEQVTIILNEKRLSDWLMEDRDREAAYRARHGLYDALPATTCERVASPVFELESVANMWFGDGLVKSDRWA